MTLDEFLRRYPGGDERAAEIQVWHWQDQTGCHASGFRAMIRIEHDPCDGDSDEYESSAWPTSAEAIEEAIELALEGLE